MVWNNGPISVFHGTDDLSASEIQNNGIDKIKFNSKKEFGIGFYVTSNRYQAEQWANQKSRRTKKSAIVIEYDLPLDDIEKMRRLSFVSDSADFYDFVTYCRAGGTNHGSNRSYGYDVIYGPVTIWPQKLVIADCDQIFISDPVLLNIFSAPVMLHTPASGRLFL